MTIAIAYSAMTLFGFPTVTVTDLACSYHYIRPEIPYGAHGEHEGQDHGDVDPVVEVLEEVAAVVLEYGLQVLGDEEGVDGVAADLREADEDVDDLAHRQRPARPEAARVQESRLAGVGVVKELDVGAAGAGLGCFIQ